MELLKWIVFFTGIASNPNLNKINVYDLIESNLKLTDNRSELLWKSSNRTLFRQRRFRCRFPRNESEYYIYMSYPNMFEFTARFGILNVFKFMLENKAENENTTVRHALNEILRGRPTDKITVAHLGADGGHMNILKYLIDDNGVEANITDKRGYNLLHMAVMNNNLDMTKYFVEEKNISINNYGHGRRTALQMAVENRNFEVFKYLIERGANVTTKASLGFTVLHSAAFRGHFDMVKYLIETQHQDINAKSNAREKLTPLLCAVSNGHTEIVKYLLDKNASTDGQTVFGNTALHYAAEQGKLNVVKWLVEDKKMSIYVRKDDGSTPFHVSVLKAPDDKKLEMIKYFVEEKGADISIANNEGKTTLLFAVYGRNLDVIKYLVSKKADVNVVNEYGMTVLHISIYAEKYDFIKYFIEEANVSIATEVAVDLRNRTILHYACVKLAFDLVKYLVNERRLDISARDTESRTPLHYVTKSGNVEIVKYLIENGADVNAKDTHGASPYDIANEQQQQTANTKDRNNYANIISLIIGNATVS